MKPKLTLEILKTEAQTFAQIESAYQEPSLYGVTDGKAVGTYFEQSSEPTCVKSIILKRQVLQVG